MARRDFRDPEGRTSRVNIDGPSTGVTFIIGLVGVLGVGPDVIFGGIPKRTRIPERSVGQILDEVPQTGPLLVNRSVPLEPVGLRVDLPMQGQLDNGMYPLSDNHTVSVGGSTVYHLTDRNPAYRQVQRNLPHIRKK